MGSLPPQSRPTHDLLRAELIRETVVRAARECPFYHDLYNSSGVDLERFGSLDDLGALPWVDKEQLRRAGTRALSESASVVSHLQSTSGTTGEPFLLYRSSEEVSFIQEFCYELIGEREVDPVPIVLQFTSPVHGRPTPVPAQAFPIQCSTRDRDSLERVLHFLKMEFSLPGVQKRASVLSGAQEEIIALTSFVIEEAVPCGEQFAVRAIHITGSYLTDRVRKLLETTWNATVTSRYSLSEISGGATRCSQCDGYHFDPHVMPELLNFSGRSTVTEGTGVLLLTSLYPFVQMQPMIRYRTGDIFSVGPSACAAPRYVFLGRESNAVFEPNEPNDPLLTGVDLIEALDSNPEIAPLRATGYSSVLDGICTLLLRVGLVVPLEFFPLRREILRRRIMRALLQRSPRLAARVSSGRVRLHIEFLPASALAEPAEYLRWQTSSRP